MFAMGKLFHHFHGTYWVSVVFVADKDENLTKLMEYLQKNVPTGTWELIDKRAVWSGTRDSLSVLKVELDKLHKENMPCGYKSCPTECSDAEIDSIKHSVDYGPVFKIQVEI